MDKAQLLKRLKAFTHKEAYFGPQGFNVICKTAQINKAQVGYLVDKTGQSLAETENSNWQESWLVIAKDTEIGDPYFVDLTDENLAVYTALAPVETHQWQTELVASSLEGFAQCLSLIADKSQQVSPSYVVDNNCIFDLEELEIFGMKLVDIAQTNDFWQNFFVSYVDWLRDEHV